MPPKSNRASTTRLGLDGALLTSVGKLTRLVGVVNELNEHRTAAMVNAARALTLRQVAATIHNALERKALVIAARLAERESAAALRKFERVRKAAERKAGV